MVLHDDGKNENLEKFKNFKSEIETCGQHIFTLKLDNGGKYPNKFSLIFLRPWHLKLIHNTLHASTQWSYKEI
jgi:hypothetical protein